MFVKICIWILVLSSIALGNIFIQLSDDEWFKAFGGCLCILGGVLIMLAIMA